jgi:hypothetical protein
MLTHTLFIKTAAATTAAARYSTIPISSHGCEIELKIKNFPNIFHHSSSGGRQRATIASFFSPRLSHIFSVFVYCSIVK